MRTRNKTGECDALKLKVRKLEKGLIASCAATKMKEKKIQRREPQAALDGEATAHLA